MQAGAENTRPALRRKQAPAHAAIVAGLQRGRSGANKTGHCALAGQWQARISLYRAVYFGL